ncbi:unnamed protein product [Jaminaea pallidilutea]
MDVPSQSPNLKRRRSCKRAEAVKCPHTPFLSDDCYVRAVKGAPGTRKKLRIVVSDNSNSREQSTSEISDALDAAALALRHGELDWPESIQEPGRGWSTPTDSVTDDMLAMIEVPSITAAAGESSEGPAKAKAAEPQSATDLMPESSRRNQAAPEGEATIATAQRPSSTAPAKGLGTTTDSSQYLRNGKGAVCAASTRCPGSATDSTKVTPLTTIPFPQAQRSLNIGTAPLRQAPQLLSPSPPPPNSGTDLSSSLPSSPGPISAPLSSAAATAATAIDQSSFLAAQAENQVHRAFEAYRREMQRQIEKRDRRVAALQKRVRRLQEEIQRSKAGEGGRGSQQPR